MSLAQWVSMRSWVSILLQTLGVLRAQTLASLFQAWMLWSKNVRGKLSTPVQPKPCTWACGEEPGSRRQRCYCSAAWLPPSLWSGALCWACPGRSSATLSRRGLQSWKNGILINIPDVIVYLTVALQNSPLWRVCISYSRDAAIAQNVFGICFTIVFTAWYSSFFLPGESFPLYLAASGNTDNPIT